MNTYASHCLFSFYVEMMLLEFSTFKSILVKKNSFAMLSLFSSMIKADSIIEPIPLFLLFYGSIFITLSPTPLA